MTEDSIYVQNHMPGNICFGCGSENPEGLQIKSHWDRDRLSTIPYLPQAIEAAG